MPLELGMTITWANLNPNRHTWFVWESESYRLQRSASDLNGTDPHIHGGTPEGILRELCNAFRREGMPSVPRMLDVIAIRLNLDAFSTRTALAIHTTEVFSWSCAGYPKLLRI
jgi:hypothetical protein